MNLQKAVKKAGPFGLIASGLMKPGEGVTTSGHPAIYLKDTHEWKVFWELKAKLSWDEASASNWGILPYKLSAKEIEG